MKSYFHVSSSDHAPGSILKPGNWGRQSRQFVRGGQVAPDANALKILTWEVGLEIARRSIKPEAPSRLGCVFACRSQDDARSFRDRYRKNSRIYEVSVPDDTALFVGDFDLISGGDQEGGTFADHWIDNSILYWTKDPSGLAEILLGGQAMVKREV